MSIVAVISPRCSAARVHRSREGESKRSGFTLVELLVCMGIIVLLIAFLMPALKTARTMAQRTQCMSNLHTISQGVLAYAGRFQGAFPPSNYPSGEWCYAFDLKCFSAAPYKPMGLGLLISENIIPASTAGRVFHDPAMDTSGNGLLGAPNHCMDVEPQQYWWGKFAGASYFASTTDARIIYAYNYRAPSYYLQHNSRQLSMGRQPNGLILASDMLDNRFGWRWTHHTGYNVVRMDGSAVWFSDRAGDVDQMGNGITVDGIAYTANDEAIYTYIEKRIN